MLAGTLSAGSQEFQSNLAHWLSQVVCKEEYGMARTAKQHEMRPEDVLSARAVERTLEVIGGKWTVQILRDLFEGTRRFGQLQLSLGGVSPKMLIARLRELEERGLVTRTLFPEIPPRVEYSLTEDGKTLRPIVDAMALWGQHAGEDDWPLARAAQQAQCGPRA